MIHLLPHNQKTLAEVWEFFEASNFSGGKAAITNCTGLGKSYVIMAAMERFQQMGKGKILLLAPTWEVIDQFLENGDFPDSDQIRYGIYQTLMKKRKMFANKAFLHRYPMLLVDRVLEVSEDEIVALKNVTVNEPFFNGHFPQYPVMPGVLIMEALAQTAGVLELSKEENKGKLVFYAGMDKVKFKKQVVPGDQLIMTAKFVKRRGTIAVVEAKAEVDGKLAASGTLTFAIGQ